jgi:RNA polymerase sigma-70 factor (ECF subfamily)
VPIGTVKSRCARGRARLVPILTHLRTSNGGNASRRRGRNPRQGTSVPQASGPRDADAVKGGGGRA